MNVSRPSHLLYVVLSTAGVLATSGCGSTRSTLRIRPAFSATPPRYVRPYDRAKILARLGDHDAALDQLDLALAEGGNWLNYLRVDPAVDPLRGNERFEAIVADVYVTAPAAESRPD